MDSSFKPKLSVCMITYNHAEYIEQAIESVLFQSTRFPVELVIGEDASSDGTATKIRRFLLNPTPVKIRARFNSKNLGMLENFVRTLSECDGDYVALLEGDDYWTDASKLQQQVDFLELNPEFSICYHPVDVLRDNRLETDTLTLNVHDVSGIRELAKGNFMHTCSVVFRARLFDKFPDSFFSSSVGDYFLHMLNARFGLIKRLPHKMGVYRIHGGGVWSSQIGVDLKILNYLDAMIGCFDPEINQLLKDRYQKIAYKSFYSRIYEDGFEERLLRCLKHGTDEIALEMTKMVSCYDKFQRNFLIRAIQRFLIILGRFKASG